MPIVDRKRRQFLARQQLILEQAETLYTKHGYLGLNLEELASRIEYSKATLYNHYTSKEELLCAVAVKFLEERAFLLSHALVFEGPSRERICFAGVAAAFLQELHPRAFELIQLVALSSLWEKVTPEIQRNYRNARESGHRALREIIRQARLAGDLEADEAALPGEEILSALEALTAGTAFARTNRVDAEEGAWVPPPDCLFRHHSAYLDGIGWRVHSGEKDYRCIRRRATEILREAAVVI